MGQIRYVIKGSWMAGRDFYQGYIKINDDSSLSILSTQNDASLFTSQVLANGWLIKVQMKFPTYKFSIVKT